MSVIAIIGALKASAGGARSALALLAVMALIAARHWPEPVTPADVLRRRVGLCLAFSALVYSPVHAAWLLGHPAPPIIARSLDLVGTLAACAALISFIGAGAALRDVPPVRIRRSMLMNSAIVFAFVALAWIAA